jgi:hypothetical protein
VVNASSTIVRGSLTCGSGSATAAGTLATITFGSTLPSVPFVMVTPTTAGAGTLASAVTGVSTTGFSLLTVAPTASQTATTFGFGWFLSL